MTTKIYLNLQMGYSLKEAISEFKHILPMIFSKLISGELSGASVPIKEALDICITINKQKSSFYTEIFIANLPLLFLTSGIFLGINYSAEKNLAPIYGFIKSRKGYFLMPETLNVFMINFTFFKSLILPVILSLIGLVILKKVINIGPFAKILDFISYYIFPFNYLYFARTRMIFIATLQSFVKNGMLLQNALYACGKLFENRYLSMNMSHCNDRVSKGILLVDSYRDCKMLSARDKDTLFVSSVGLNDRLKDLIKSFNLKLVITKSLLSSTVKLFLIFFTIYWALGFMLAWFGLFIQYLLK